MKGSPFIAFALAGLLACVGSHLDASVDWYQDGAIWHKDGPIWYQDGPMPSGIVGIGAVLRGHEGDAIIASVLPNNPAMKAGLKVDDIIVQVDDTKTSGMNLRQVVEMIRGTAGTSVQINVKRKGASAPLIFVLTRRPVPLPSPSP